MLGLPISAIPILRPAGIIIALVGMIWYSFGRHLFGSRQSNLTAWAMAIFLLGLGFVLVGSVAYLLFVLSIGASSPTILYWWYGNNAMASALAPSLGLILSLDVTGSVLTSLSYFLISFYPQDRNGRGLLCLALAASVILSILEFSILTSSNSYHILVSYPTDINWDTATAFQNKALSVSVLSLIPAVIYALGFYRLRSRIRDGELASSS
jgi:hypothetical protein